MVECEKYTLRLPIFQVLAALGTEYFEHLLPDIIRNCSHQRASVRDGYLTLFKVIIVYRNLYLCVYVRLNTVSMLSLLMFLFLNMLSIFPKVIGYPISEIPATGLACYIRW